MRLSTETFTCAIVVKNLALQVASGSDDHTVILWDTTKGNQLHTVAFRSAVMSVAWHPEEVSKLMIGEKNGVVHIFNIVSYHVYIFIYFSTYTKQS
jgi:WD40 repeat protein